MDADFMLVNEDEPQQFSQGELNDLIRDLAPSKDKVELLTSRLKQKCPKDE